MEVNWTVKDTLGEVLDGLDEPVAFYLGGQDLRPKIVEVLQGHAAGAKVDLHLEPEDAFGDFDENLLFLEPRALFPKDIEEGLTIEGNALPAGCNPDAPRNVLYTITEIYPDHLVLDGNHPLSGIALRISLKVNRVRLATDQEQEAGTCGTGFFKIEIGDTPGSAGGLLH